MKIIILIGLLAFASCSEYQPKYHYDETVPEHIKPSLDILLDNIEISDETVDRQKRSFFPGAPGVTSTTTPRTVISPDIHRGEDGTVNAGTTFEHHGKDYDVNGHWNKNVRGPGRAKPTWGIRGTYRFRRSLQPGAPGQTTTTPRTAISPDIHRGEDGTVNAGTTFEHHGKNYDVDGHWNKNVRGPGRAKPTWGVRGTIRFRRSVQPGAPGQSTTTPRTEISPDIHRGEDGTVNAGSSIIHHGDNYDVNGYWNKNVRGPGRAKPVWGVGATFRFRRSLQPGAPGQTTTTPRTAISPDIHRGEDGTVNAGTTFEHHGKNYDVDGHWNKNVRGPGRAKPTWGVRGTFRFRRSLQPGAPGQTTTTPPTAISPDIHRGEDGTVNAGTTFEHHGKDYDVNGHWNKNVRGPGRAKPTWGVRGTFRFRRSVQPGAPGQTTTTPRTAISPDIHRGEDGTVNAGTTFEHHGKDYDVNGHWNKNVRGPGRAKPTWGIRGTIRF